MSRSCRTGRRGCLAPRFSASAEAGGGGDDGAERPDKRRWQ